MCHPFLQATLLVMAIAQERKTTASFSYADHLNLDTAILRATLFRAVVGDRVGFARAASPERAAQTPISP